MNMLYAVLVLGLLGGLFGLALIYADKVFHVETDEREERITALLPGANCGGCGFAGCGECARAIVSHKADVSACVPGGNETATKVAELMGVQASARELTVAFVRCSSAGKGQKYDYVGVKDCLAATMAGSSTGPKLCENGCLGFGTCVNACKFQALHIKNGVAQVDADACTGCGECVNACPKKLIEMIPYGVAVTAPCNSCAAGNITNKACDGGCIACKRCEKVCEHSAISVVNNHAVIDYAQCVHCGKCVESCPRSLLQLDPRFLK